MGEEREANGSPYPPLADKTKQGALPLPAIELSFSKERGLGPLLRSRELRLRNLGNLRCAIGICFSLTVVLLRVKNRWWTFELRFVLYWLF